MMNTVELLDEEFKTIVESQKNLVEEIQKAMDELEEKSVFIQDISQRTTLSEIDQFLWRVEQMKEITADAKAKYVTYLIRQSEKTIEELSKMRTLLRDFED